MKIQTETRIAGPLSQALSRPDSGVKTTAGSGRGISRAATKGVSKPGLYITLMLCCLFTGLLSQAGAQTFILPLSGEKTAWRGDYDRYDFQMDTTSLAIRPVKAASSEGFGLRDSIKGEVRCVLVVPRHAAAGNPWCWRGFYWDHEPQYEVELLNRGFYIAYINCDPGRQWEAWYSFLRTRGLGARPAFGGMSRGGIDAYTWATTHPDKVSCIYGDNPAIRPESLAKMGLLADADIPLLNVCGSQDFLYEKNTLPIETIYHEHNGRITVIIKEGTAHHPHSLRNPNLIADWIDGNMQPVTGRPEYLDSTYKSSWYYSLRKTYVYLKEEDTWASCSGPGYTPCYRRFDKKNPSFYGISTPVIIYPEKPATGKPWIFRSDRIDRDALVDQELLGKGYTLVITPLTAQSGAVSTEWDAVYTLFTGQGFARKVILEGTGASAGEAYAWAIKSPGKVSCIYTINPVMHSLMYGADSKLKPLAEVHIPLLNVCGSLDPWLKTNTLVVKEKYSRLGGKMKLLLIPGEGHFITPDPKLIVPWLVENSR